MIAIAQVQQVMRGLSHADRMEFERQFTLVRRNDETAALLAYTLSGFGAQRFYLDQPVIGLRILGLNALLLLCLVAGFAFDISLFKLCGGLLFVVSAFVSLHEIIRHAAITDKENWRRRGQILADMGKLATPSTTGDNQ